MVHVSECDVVPVKGLRDMTYREAIETLRQMKQANAKQLRNIELIDVETGRYVSWSV
jgi:hypothetical protein